MLDMMHIVLFPSAPRYGHTVELVFDLEARSQT